MKLADLRKECRDCYWLNERYWVKGKRTSGNACRAFNNINDVFINTKGGCTGKKTKEDLKTNPDMPR